MMPSVPWEPESPCGVPSYMRVSYHIPCMLSLSPLREDIATYGMEGISLYTSNTTTTGSMCYGPWSSRVSHMPTYHHIAHIPLLGKGPYPMV